VGNFTLTVGGANFVKGSKVMFGGTALATTYVSVSQLTAAGTATAAQKGMVKVTVENPDPGKITSTTSMNTQVANWFGIPTADLPTIFPNLPNFSNQLMSFMG